MAPTRRDVKRPGSRGATKWYRDTRGLVRYGDPPGPGHEVIEALGPEHMRLGVEAEFEHPTEGYAKGTVAAWGPNGATIHVRDRVGDARAPVPYAAIRSLSGSPEPKAGRGEGAEPETGALRPADAEAQEAAAAPAPLDRSGAKEFLRVAFAKRHGAAIRGLVAQGPEDVAAMMAALKDADREQFWTVMTDRKGRVLALDAVSVGSLSASLVHPREVFKTARAAGAERIWLVHNHPSGRPEPSPEDRALTQRLRAAGHLIGVDVAGHVVIGEGRAYDVEGDREFEVAAAQLPAATVEVKTVRRAREGLWEEALSRPERVARAAAALLSPGATAVVAFYVDAQNGVNGAFQVAGEEHLEPPGQRRQEVVRRILEGALVHNAFAVFLASNASGNAAFEFRQLAAAAKDAVKLFGMSFHDAVGLEGEEFVSHESGLRGPIAGLFKALLDGGLKIFAPAQVDKRRLVLRNVR